MEMDLRGHYDVQHFWGCHLLRLLLGCWGWLVAFERCQGEDCRCLLISWGQGCLDLVCIAS